MSALEPVIPAQRDGRRPGSGSRRRHRQRDRRRARERGRVGPRARCHSARRRGGFAAFVAVSRHPARRPTVGFATPVSGSLRPVKVGDAPSLTVDALRGEMATHRRGRGSQWQVRDLLGPASGRARCWDPRLYAAVGGLLACGAAATVASAGQPGGAGPALEGPADRWRSRPRAPPVRPLRRLGRPPRPAPPQRRRAARPRTRGGPRTPQRAAAAPPRVHRVTARRYPLRRRATFPRGRARRGRTLAEQVATAATGGRAGRGRTGRSSVGSGYRSAAGGCGRAAGLATRRALPRAGPGGRPGPGSRRRAACRPAPRGPRRPAPRARPAPRGRGGRHRAPRQDDQRSTPYRCVTDDGAGHGRGRPGRAGTGRGPRRACRSPRAGRTVHDADRIATPRRPTTIRRAGIRMRMTPLTSGSLAT